MRTTYVRFCYVADCPSLGMLACPFDNSGLLRVTRNRLGKQVVEFVSMPKAEVNLAEIRQRWPLAIVER